MNAQQALQIAGFIAGMSAVLSATVNTVSPRLPDRDRSFLSGFVTASAMLGALLFFLSAIIKVI